MWGTPQQLGVFVEFALPRSGVTLPAHERWLTPYRPSWCRSDKHKSRRRAPPRRDRRSFCWSVHAATKCVSAVLASLFPGRCCASTSDRQIVSPAAPEFFENCASWLRALFSVWKEKKEQARSNRGHRGVEDGRTRAHSARMACARLLLGTRGVLSCFSSSRAPGLLLTYTACALY